MSHGTNSINKSWRCEFGLTRSFTVWCDGSWNLSRELATIFHQQTAAVKIETTWGANAQIVDMISEERRLKKNRNVDRDPEILSPVKSNLNSYPQTWLGAEKK